MQRVLPLPCPPTCLHLSLSLSFPFSTCPQTLHRPACRSLPIASTVPSGSQEAPPQLLSSCLWLEQRGQSPLDPQGAPISRDVSESRVQLGQQGGVAGKDQMAGTVLGVRRGRKRQKHPSSPHPSPPLESPERLPHQGILFLRKCSSKAVTPPARARPSPSGLGCQPGGAVCPASRAPA